MDGMKIRNNKNHFQLTIIGNYNNIIKEMEKFDNLVLDNLRKYKI